MLLDDVYVVPVVKQCWGYLLLSDRADTCLSVLLNNVDVVCVVKKC